MKQFWQLINFVSPNQEGEVEKKFDKIRQIQANDILQVILISITCPVCTSTSNGKKHKNKIMADCIKMLFFQREREREKKKEKKKIK